MRGMRRRHLLDLPESQLVERGVNKNARAISVGGSFREGSKQQRYMFGDPFGSHRPNAPI